MHANPQICYVLTGNGDCIYTQMTCISALLTRRLYPGCKIIVLVDEMTSEALAHTHSTIRSIADEIRCVQTGLNSPGARNRFVKTRMRQIVNGDFVYLDADAFPIRRFDEMFECGAPLAASLDLDDMTWKPHLRQCDIEILKQCGWRSAVARFFNAGVFFYADCPQARSVGEEWHARWKYMSAKFNDYRDQPAFNSAIDATGVQVCILPRKFNTPITLSPWFGRGARILHYWMNASDGAPPRTMLHRLLQVYRQTVQIDWQAVERARMRPLSFYGWREILMALLGPRGRIPRKWLWNLSKSLNRHQEKTALGL